MQDEYYSLPTTSNPAICYSSWQEDNATASTVAMNCSSSISSMNSSNNSNHHQQQHPHVVSTQIPEVNSSIDMSFNHNNQHYYDTSGSSTSNVNNTYWMEGCYRIPSNNINDSNYIQNVSYMSSNGNYNNSQSLVSYDQLLDPIAVYGSADLNTTTTNDDDDDDDGYFGAAFQENLALLASQLDDQTIDLIIRIFK